MLTKFVQTVLMHIQKCCDRALNSTLCSSLNAVSELKRFFERKGSIVDSEMREVFVRNIPRAIVTSEQRDIVEEQVRGANLTMI